MRIAASRAVAYPPDVSLEATIVDVAGEPHAYGAAKGRRRWIRVPEVADFSWTSGSDVLTATPHPDADDDFVLDEINGVAIPLFLHATRGYEIAHASAVASVSDVFGFCGSTGCGKSTIAHGLALRGHRIWADDVLAFQVDSEHAVATALPFRPNLRTASRDFFRRSTVDDGRDVDLGTVAPWSIERLSGLFVLAPKARTRKSSWIAEVTRLGAAEALAALLPHGMRFKPFDKGREQQILTAYVDLVANVPVFSVTYKRGFAAFPGLIDRLEAVIRQLGPDTPLVSRAAAGSSPRADRGEEMQHNPDRPPDIGRS